MKYMTIVIISLLAVINCQAGSKFPRGCQPVGHEFKDGNLVLDQDESKQTLYFIHNNSNRKLHLQNMKDPGAFMTPNWETHVNHNRWVAFATDHKRIIFRCKTLSSRLGDEYTDCENILQVCQYPKAKFALSNLGNYWVSTNKSLNSTVRASIRKGILLRW